MLILLKKKNLRGLSSKLFSNTIFADEYELIMRCEDFHSFNSSESVSDDTLNVNITLSADEWESLCNNST